MNDDERMMNSNRRGHRTLIAVVCVTAGLLAIPFGAWRHFGDHGSMWSDVLYYLGFCIFIIGVITWKTRNRATRA